MVEKKRRVLSYENMDEVLRAAFEEKYPKGFNDYLQDLSKYEKPDGTPFYAVPIETEDTIALVKIQIKTDDAEDIERWLDSDSEDPSAEDDDDTESLPDDNISQYSNGEDDSADQD